MTEPVRGILCDLDGVVYRGEEACPGAVDGLLSARAAGVRVLFMTNNASRTPQDVADHLGRLGLPTSADEVMTASQVAAAVLAEQVADDNLMMPAGSLALAVGGEGVGAALEEAGVPWTSPSRVREAAAAGQATQIAVVVQGYGADLTTLDLTEAVYALASGAAWIATNDDATIPTTRGFGVGNGSLVAAVAHASGRTPEVVGKPHAAAYHHAVARLGVPESACLMIGDRMDTDIVGAAQAGLRSALVLTGVSSAEDAAAAPAHHRPDHVVATIPDLEHLWTQS